MFWRGHPLDMSQVGSGVEEAGTARLWAAAPLRELWDTHNPKEELSVSPCGEWCGSASGPMPLVGKGDPFFPRVSFVGRVSGGLSVPKSKCLVTLRYSPRAGLGLGRDWRSQWKGKTRSQNQVLASPCPSICMYIPEFQLW